MNRYLALQQVVNTSSFTKAAEALGYTQSSISQMMASLEKEFGMKLLNRSRHGVGLTLEGKEIYPFIERTILQYRALQEKVQEMQGLSNGIIRVGTFSSITCHWMPQLIKGFQKLYPNIQFVFHQGDNTLIPEWVRTGAIDFGFIGSGPDSDLETIHIKDGEMQAVLPKEHPFAKAKSVPLEELTKSPYILLEEGKDFESLKAFESAGLKPDIKYRIHDDYAIMTMVEAGLGVSMLSKLVLKRNNFNIACRPISPPVYRGISIVYKDKTSLPLASQYFIKYLQEHIDELP